MLQIIGLLGCFYLLVKCFEIVGSQAHRNAEGNLVPPAVLAVSLAALGAIGFAFWLYEQGSAFDPTVLAAAESGDSCMESATTLEEALAC